MNQILQIAIPCPLRSVFDYISKEPLLVNIGSRVEVSFGSRIVIGFIVNIRDAKNKEDLSKLKSINAVLDNESLLPDDLLKLIHWLANYYHHPIGDCFQTVLPKKIRLGEAIEFKTEVSWRLQSKFNSTIKITSKQSRIIDLLKRNKPGLSQSEINQQCGQSHSVLIALQKKQLITNQVKIKQSSINTSPELSCHLNQQQQDCVNNVWKHHDSFNVALLHGITGSGKTEVYIQLSKQIIEQKKQVLILIPEIGLTTQFVARFKQQLASRIETINSSVSDAERKQTWLLAKAGLVDIIIGTRSAVFSPLNNIGLIIIDEEHDASYKQQDGLRYHARNVALVRAKNANIPVLLGSATPSLESLYHVKQQRYQLLQLTQRATGASLPKVHMVDSAGPKAQNGLSSILYHAIKEQLELDNQVLLFINRRGFAPVLMCHECNWQATCQHCDAKMIVHQRRNTLCCHHCGLIQRLLTQCPKCQSTELHTYGAGTEQIEISLQTYFPDTPVLRIDRDSTQRVNSFADIVADIRKGGARVLVGTQMLAKGHDFHDVTLVGVLDADQGLLSADFRATESLAQLITQVTGRAGRGSKPGQVYIQTNQPQHSFWKDLIQQGYSYTAEKLLEERQLMAMPPIAYMSIFRAEDQQEQLAMQFLTEVQAIFSQNQQDVLVLGPVPAIMEKRAGRFRAQLLLSCPTRKPIHQLLDHYMDAISKLKLSRKVRWSIDIDPIDLM
jgi:primosomal protein N' (replication factor Y)